MNNFKAAGAHMDYKPTVAVLASTMVLVGTKVGVAIADIAANTTGALRVTGVVNYTKNTADVVAQGAALYWDNTNKRLTTTSAGNTYAGYAFAAATGTDTTVDIKIND
jgi:predicted RecA/RadA family phage recombinase